MKSVHPYLFLRACLFVILFPTLLITGCAPLPIQNILASELILYNWADYMPQSVLDAFT